MAAFIAMRIWLGAIGTSAMTTVAIAGGTTLPVQGVHSLARGGALVAGAEDADALWLDPAGLAHLAGDGKRAFLFDAAYLYEPVSITSFDGAGNPVDKVTNQQPGSGLPTIAAALGIGPSLVIAGGITSPYAGLHRYDDTGSQRYASISLAGSRFVIVTVGAAYAVTPRLRIGATLQDFVSSVSARLAVSDCPPQMSCAAGDRTFDAIVQIDQNDYVSPSGSLGVQYDATPRITLGATLQAPTRVSSTGKLAMTIPTSTVFRGAMISGDQAGLTFTLPVTARAGIEFRSGGLRVEAALDVELWSMHDTIVIEPAHVQIEQVSGIGSLPVGTITIPRHGKTSFAPSLGAEYHVGDAMVAAGVAYETAATPAAYLSAMTVDAAKLLVGVGGGYEAEGWQIGAAAGLVKQSDVTVAVADAKLLQPQPLRETPSPVFVNAGSYHASYVVAGIRAARRF
ncbi:MAG: rane protein involved in aromatic hydrocarbon degradation [Myxococcales bacterium]|nr:rane protein involved in aromatic hydrocarbon degradation [Myxococcales bacterium]